VKSIVSVALGREFGFRLTANRSRPCGAPDKPSDARTALFVVEPPRDGPMATWRGGIGGRQIVIGMVTMPEMKNFSSYGLGESFAQGEC
jgi:hypothetical protein